VPLTLEEATRFHGHKGPWLVIGYKAGLRALEVLGSGIRCSVRLPPSTPYTCLVDGIQCSSGCTLGKGLIEVLEGDENSMLIVFRSGDGKTLELKPRRGFIDTVKKLLNSLGVEGAGEVVERWSYDQIFEERLYP